MAIHRSRSHGSSDVPTEYVIAYIAVALAVWITVAVYAARHEAATDHRSNGPTPPPDKEQLLSGVTIGALAAIAWPVTAIGAGVWLAVRRLTHPAPNQPKEPRDA
jgi:hypothetical protein